MHAATNFRMQQERSQTPLRPIPRPLTMLSGFDPIIDSPRVRAEYHRETAAGSRGSPLLYSIRRSLTTNTTGLVFRPFIVRGDVTD